MSKISDDLRAAVSERSGRRCEYCQLPDVLQIGGFEIDHVIPVASGGQTSLENLAHCCPHCNDHKWAHVDGPDSITGQTVPLYHPRKDRWDDHFECSAESWEIHGKTPCGRATIARLQMNHPEMTSIRRAFIKLGIPAVAEGHG